MNRHTPGPWKTGTNYPGRIISSTGYSVIAQTTQTQYEGTETETEIANARLIAAAPELLDMCEALADVYAIKWPDGALVKEARAIIAKARGEG